MTKVKATEPEFRTQVISWLNKFFDQGGYPFELASGELTMNTAEGKRFPDVQLWINREAEDGFCGWELKQPTVRADYEELVKNAVEKALHMNAEYFVTWNMRDSIIWRIIDKEKKKAKQLYIYPSLKHIESVDDLSVKGKRIILEEHTKQILQDLVRLYNEGALTYIGSNDYFFIKRLTETTRSIQPYFKDRLLQKSADSKKFRNTLDAWATRQGFLVDEDKDTYYTKLASQIVYQLLGRLLFFEVLRRFIKDLAPIKIEGLSEKQANKELQKKFAEVRAIDYQAVFEEDLPDQIEVPKEAIPHLAQLINDLGKRDFAHLPQEVLGNVFENLIPPEERHRLGQYFTPEDLVDFIIAFCVKHKSDKILDPTCGTGTFLVRAYSRFKWDFMQHDHQELLSQIWGVDIAPFPAELATINLYRQSISNIGNFPRILKEDFFKIRQGKEYEFPPNKAFKDDPHKKIKEEFPVFDAIVGNPPYIRQEDITKLNPRYDEQVIDPAIHEDVAELQKEIEYKRDQVKLSGQADIYAHMFVHATPLLKEGGRLGFVTSNSWLGSGYGKELQRFFLNYFKVIAVVESRVEPWFDTAQVNTIFTILEKCKSKKERDDNLVKFISVKKKLKELIPWSMDMDPDNRWHNLSQMVSKLENLGVEYYSKELPKLVSSYEDDNFKVNFLRQGELRGGVADQFGTGHWGRFLRAPDVYLELRNVLNGSLIKLTDKNVSEIKRGITAGITNFFILDEDQERKFKVESKYLKPIVMSLREIGRPALKKSDTQKKLFLCNASEADLRKTNSKGALGYINWGKRQATGSGAPWPEVPSVQSRQIWYAVGKHDPGDVIINRFVGERLFFPINENKLYISDTFFEVKFNDTDLKDLWVALFNSGISYLISEVHGRLTWSAGVLYLYGPEIKSLLVPDARKIDEEYKDKILEAFESIKKRKIKKISQEVKQKDRRKFDSLILEALGLDPEKYLDRIYDGLVELVETRVKLGKMQKIKKDSKKKKDISKVKEEVINEVVPDGLTSFPAAFVKSGVKFEQISVPQGKLRMGNYFMGQQEVVSDKEETLKTSSPEAAQYIVFAQDPNSHMIRIPESQGAIEESIKAYRAYIKKIREKLMREFIVRTGDEKLSERLSAEVLDELGGLL